MADESVKLFESNGDAKGGGSPGAVMIVPKGPRPSVSSASLASLSGANSGSKPQLENLKSGTQKSSGGASGSCNSGSCNNNHSSAPSPIPQCINNNNNSSSHNIHSNNNW